MDPEIRNEFERELNKQGLPGRAGGFFQWVFFGSFVVLVGLLVMFQPTKSFQYAKVISVRVLPDKDAEERLVTVDIAGKEVAMLIRDRLVWPQKGQLACIASHTGAVLKITTYSVTLDIFCIS